MTTATVAIITAPCLFLIVVAPRTTAVGLALAVDLVVAALLLAAALVVGAEARQRSMSLALAGACACWLLNLPVLEGPRLLPWLVWCLAPSFWWLLAWVLLRYPARDVAPLFDRGVVAGATVWVTVVHLLTGLVVRPAPSNGLPSGIWWPTLSDDPALQLWTARLYYAVGGCLAIAYLVAAVRRWRRLRSIDRWLAAPSAVSVMAVVVPAATWLASAVVPADRLSLLIAASQRVVLPGLPLSLLLVASRQRLARAAVAESLAVLPSPASLEAVQAALREGLRDPGLLVVLDDGDHGPPVAPEVRSQEDSRVAFAIRDVDGRPFAVLRVESSLAAHPDLLEAATSGSAHALQNAQLHERLRRELDDLAASRRRLHESSVSQRRALERDLHDGVQQRLLALALGLGATVAQHRPTLGDEVGADLDRVRRQLHSVMGEVRDLAHGIHPAVLTQSGLAGAVGDLVDRLPLEVRCHVSPGRWPDTVETTAYYIVCEALNNVVKHAGASAAHVTITDHDGELVVEVGDDGTGGVRAEGAGVRGMSDRAAALGGRLEIDANGAGGTTVRARIPCG